MKSATVKHYFYKSLSHINATVTNTVLKPKQCFYPLCMHGTEHCVINHNTFAMLLICPTQLETQKQVH